MMTGASGTLEKSLGKFLEKSFALEWRLGHRAPICSVLASHERRGPLLS